MDLLFGSAQGSGNWIRQGLHPHRQEELAGDSALSTASAGGSEGGVGRVVGGLAVALGEALYGCFYKLEVLFVGVLKIRALLFWV